MVGVHRTSVSASSWCWNCCLCELAGLAHDIMTQVQTNTDGLLSCGQGACTYLRETWMRPVLVAPTVQVVATIW